MKKEIFVLLFVFVCFNVFASKRAEYVFKQIDNKQGLSQNGVISIFQDNDGCMWFGTRYGFNKYDGFNITNYYSGHSKSLLSGNSILAIQQDSSNNIWIATNEGITLFNPKRQLFYNLKYYQKESMVNHALLSMKFIDDKILISNNEGLWEITPPQGEVTEDYAQNLPCKRIKIPETLSQLKIHGRDLNDNLLLTTENKSIVIATITDGKLAIVDQLFPDLTQNNIEITTLYCDKLSNIWVGTSMHGLYLIKRYGTNYSRSAVCIDPTNIMYRITDILQDNDNNIWVTSRSHGVMIIPDPLTFTDKITYYKLTETELSTQKIKCIYKSRDNTLWLGSLGSGVFLYNPSNNKFRNYRLSESSYDNSVNYVRAIIKDSYDRLWFGTFFNGIYVCEPDEQHVKKFALNNTSIFTFAAIDHKHIMTGGSAGLSLISYDKHRAQTTELLSREEIGGTIFCIANKSNKFWIGTTDKIMSFTLSETYKVTKLNSFTNDQLFGRKNGNSIRILKYDPHRNSLWIGSEAAGVVRASLDSEGDIESCALVQYKSINGNFANDHICDIALDKDNICWLATYHGLIKLKLTDSGSVIDSECFSSDNGLPSNMIQSIVSDSEDNLWIGTNKGLAKFHKGTCQVIIYDMKDGIQDYEFSEHASFIDNNGCIYFGGVNGVSEISSADMKLNEFTDKVHIQDIVVNGEILDHPDSKKLTLESSENNLKFYFITYNYVNPSKCLYAYMLQGADDNWHYTTGANRVAEYVNLKSGHYTFKIKAANEDGVWGEKQVEQGLEIKPSFWATYLAFILYALILFGLTYLIVIITKYKVKQKQQKLYEMHYLQELNKLSQSKLQFFINISHEIRTPLTLISCSIEKLVNDLNLNNDQESEVSVIYNNINRILRLINELMEVQKIESGNYQLNVRKTDIISLLNDIILAFKPLTEKLNLEVNLKSSSPEIELWFDINVMEKVLCNLFSNAIKYTPSGGKIDITVSVSGSKQNLIIKVADNGIGISQANLSKIFERFHNYGANKDSYEKGFGIGLFFTKHLIEQHKGSISVESTLGKGSCFSIILPLGEEIYSTEEKADKIIRRTDLDLLVENTGTSMTDNNPSMRLPEYINNADPQRLTILLVDDNQDILNNISKYLADRYNVITASNGRAGYETALKRQPDMIISDVIMPIMDGIEFCHTLKNDINTSHIPVILLTAKGDDETHLKSMESGADYFLPKPFNMKLLNRIIENIIKSRDKIRKEFLSYQSTGIKEFTLSSKDETFVTTLLKYIDEHIAEPDLKINYIADAMNMSRATFFRKIKIITGITGKDFIDSVRLKKAAQLLLETDLNISEIAYKIGHSNPLYFSKWFKSHYKVSPSEFKQNHK